MQRKKKTIAFLVNLSRKSGRSILLSAFRFFKKCPLWDIRVLPVNEFSVKSIVTQLTRETFDGIITSELETAEIANLLESSSIPLIVIGTRNKCLPSRQKNLTIIRYDESHIGEVGAKYLLGSGNFKCFAFIHHDTPNYEFLSELRWNGFRDALQKAGKDVTVFRPDDMDDIGVRIADLPKPAAVMCSCDRMASKVIVECKRSGVRVPSSVSVIGVDNDEFYCQSINPSLTSFETNIEESGYRAAKALDAMMRHSQKRRQIIFPSICKLIERESSRTTTRGIHLVQNAIQFIQNNADHDISVENVIEHLNVSRRLADLRFHEFSGETIHEAILRIRLDKVRQRLLTDTASIEAIAHLCGFSNPFNLMTQFKKKYGMTMSEMRQCNSTTPKRNRAR